MSKPISFSLIVAGLMLAAAAALKLAGSLDLIDPEGVKRGAQVIIGLVLAAYANNMPKGVGGPMTSTIAARRSQSALRFGGWLFTLAGLGYAAAWAFAPIGVADAVATGIVAVAMVSVMSFAGWTLLACRRNKHTSLDAHAGR